MEKIEQVARAIARKRGFCPDKIVGIPYGYYVNNHQRALHETIQLPKWKFYERDAQAAIEVCKTFST